MNVGSLFSGIGGFDLGLERAGMRVAWQCEADEFCQQVLACHWPAVPCYPDVCELTGAAVESVDVLCGGFPCQDISLAGKGAGIDGARSGLWGEYARLIGELRPDYVIVENVAALLARGLGRVLGDLAALGYDAEWDCLPASAFGAPHRRDRLWLIAYPQQAGLERRRADPGEPQVTKPRDSRALADATPTGQLRTLKLEDHRSSESWREGPDALPQGEGRGWKGQWTVEPDVGRVAHGVPARVDRLASLGNALVPQIAEWLGTQILDYERGRLVA